MFFGGRSRTEERLSVQWFGDRSRTRANTEVFSDCTCAVPRQTQAVNGRQLQVADAVLERLRVELRESVANPTSSSRRTP